MSAANISLIIGAMVFVLIFVLILVPKYFLKRCKSKVCLVGKTALVTGGSQGIGYEIVLDLAQRGCRVIIADKVISNDIKNNIILETNNPEILMEFVDLGSFDSVRALALRLKNKEKKIDILIHNAGMGNCTGRISDDGLNLTMQVNYYSPFLLTHLLVDLLKNSGSARLIFCSTPLVSTFGTLLLHFKTFQYAFGEYRLSKLCLLVISDIFGKKLKGYNITSNCFHPGVVDTQIHQQFFECNIIQFLLSNFGSFCFKNPEGGAQSAIYLACANEVQNVTGRFFADLIPISKPTDLENQYMCESIWESSEKIVNLRKDELLC